MNRYSAWQYLVVHKISRRMEARQRGWQETVGAQEVTALTVLLWVYDYPLGL